ncbi:UNVERIFIED_CONTAM: hypothetical protein PYX00_002819 [Menopon gallinae]
MMFYAMIGIPMNGILLTSLAQFFSTVFIRAHKKYKRYESRCGLLVDVLKYLVPGILFFIFVPATAFYYFEEWTYDESVYFAFVTLTTIGFGDLVAGQKPFKEFNQDIILLYKILLLCWIIIGLGYLIMILGFITRAMRSKKMAQFEHKLVEALTHSKIWHGFSKDIGYLRRVMNELYLDKFKPVFLDEHQQQKQIFHRSKSLPNFAFGIDEENFFDPVDLYSRKRANSDYMTGKMKLSKVCSENDIDRIDKSATFASTSRIAPDELIRHVVGVMGGSLNRRSLDLQTLDEPRGVDVFSDDEILKSEVWSDKNASLASINYPPTYEEAVSARRKRVRALSECPPENGHADSLSSNLEWTWAGSGSTRIFDIVNERYKRTLMLQNEKNKAKSKKLSSNLAAGVKWLNPRRKRVKSESVAGSKVSVWSNGDARTISGSKPDITEDGFEGPLRTDGHYVTFTPGSGAQGIGLIHGKQGLSKPERSLMELYMSGDHLFSRENRRDALEGASIAEFLNVLSSLHNRLGSQRSVVVSERAPSPKVESLVSLFSPVENPRSPEKLQEPSNLKRLGRFLLRSYAKTDSNPDIAQKENTPQKIRKPFPVRVSDNYLADNYHTFSGNPSVSIDMEDDMDMPAGKFSNFSVEDPAQGEQGDSKANGIMSNIMRRGSTPAMTAAARRLLRERARIGVSSESVFTDPRRFSMMRNMTRWRPGESCSAKPSLSDVKEVIK